MVWIFCVYRRLQVNLMEFQFPVHYYIHQDEQEQQRELEEEKGGKLGTKIIKTVARVFLKFIATISDLEIPVGATPFLFSLLNSVCLFVAGIRLAGKKNWEDGALRTRILIKETSPAELFTWRRGMRRKSLARPSLPF